MKNINLSTITALVIASALTTNVYAEGEVKTETQPQAEVVKIEKQPGFSALIEKLDSNKNGTLSLEEISVAQNKVLQAEFNNIDANQDLQIDEAEYNRFVADVSDQMSTQENSAV